jgi:hypothetical protein
MTKATLRLDGEDVSISTDIVAIAPANRSAAPYTGCRFQPVDAVSPEGLTAPVELDLVRQRTTSAW